MRIRTVVVFAVTLIAIVTGLNFLLDNVRLMSKLPGNRIDEARRDALSKPFHEREHRLERKPRLESALSKEARMNLQEEKAMRLTAHEVVKDTLKAEGLLTQEAQGNLKADKEMRLEAAQVREGQGAETQAGGGREAAEQGVSEGVEAAMARERDRKEAEAGLRAAGKRQRLPQPKEAVEVDQRAKYHVIPSVDGGIYTEWQVRVCYYWYKQMKTKFPDSAMGGFTRLLHSGKADNLTDEIPTVVVDPLPPGVDRGYPVLNRPFAFLQWVQKYMDQIPEDYVLMAEPDHIFVKPPPLWATPMKAAAYPFSYIQPTNHVELIGRFNKQNAAIADMAHIGNSPVQLHKDHLRSVVEIWYNLSMALKADPEADKAFGWILDMYAFSIASAQTEGGPIQYEIHRELMAQPPFDPWLTIENKDVYIVHLTYGMDYTAEGKMVYGKRGDWHFDKRDYSHQYPPQQFPAMPSNIDAPAIKYVLNAMNQAFADIPGWPAGPS